jgi:tetratricopeptide (TPR) repeat protein
MPAPSSRPVDAQRDGFDLALQDQAGGRLPRSEEIGSRGGDRLATGGDSGRGGLDAGVRGSILWSMRIALLLSLVALPALAEGTCPAAPDHAAAKAELLDDLRIARDETDAAMITGDLWRLWTDAPDDRAQGMLDEGMRLIRARDYRASEAVLGDLVSYCPDYAEGWNQRAFARFLMGAHEGALDDLERALALDPRHVPAISGKALVLMHLGRQEEGQLVLREAVRLNPWIAERSLLTIPMDVEL